MSYFIAKQFAFSASHQLTHLPADHPCARLHGHNYIVELELSAKELNPATGFVVDYRELNAFRGYLDTTLDHQHLNDVLGGSMPTTAENLAAFLFAEARSRLGAAGRLIRAVRVSETPKTWAEFRP